MNDARVFDVHCAHCGTKIMASVMRIGDSEADGIAAHMSGCRAAGCPTPADLPFGELLKHVRIPPRD
jgi:hypothetical protein